MDPFAEDRVFKDVISNIESPVIDLPRQCVVLLYRDKPEVVQPLRANGPDVPED